MPTKKNHMLPEIDDLPDFEAQLTAAAPQPSATFQDRVTHEIHNALQSRTDRHTTYRIRFPTQPWLRAATVAALVLIITGTALAVGSWLLALIAGDAGLSSVYEAGQGITLNQHQTVSGYTVELEWAYADHNRLTIAYAISSPPDDVFTNLSPVHHASSIIVSSGGQSASLEFLSARGTPVEAGVAGYVSVYDMAGFVPQTDTLSVEWTLYVESVTEAVRTAFPTPSTAETDWWSGPYGPFHFHFSLPLTTDQRVLNIDQTATDQSVDITLEQVVVTASQVRLRLCYRTPDPTRIWTLIPDLRMRDTAITGGGATKTESTIDGEQACSIFTYDTAMQSYHGPWTLTISKMVGFDPGDSSDQQRIMGSWRFDFTMPE